MDEEAVGGEDDAILQKLKLRDLCDPRAGRGLGHERKEAGQSLHPVSGGLG